MIADITGASSFKMRHRWCLYLAISCQLSVDSYCVGNVAFLLLPFVDRLDIGYCQIQFGEGAIGHHRNIGKAEFGIFVIPHIGLPTSCSFDKDWIDAGSGHIRGASGSHRVWFVLLHAQHQSLDAVNGTNAFLEEFLEIRACESSTIFPAKVLFPSAAPRHLSSEYVVAENGMDTACWLVDVAGTARGHFGVAFSVFITFVVGQIEDNLVESGRLCYIATELESELIAGNSVFGIPGRILSEFRTSFSAA